VKTRKVAQLVIEIPIEAADAFIAAFGSPRPDKNVPVAIARLDPAAKAEKVKGGELARRAGIVCGERAFQTFLELNKQVPGTTRVHVPDAENAAMILRRLCGVQSRAELDHNGEGAIRFNTIMSEYRNWQNQNPLT
jgi:hypothetical protein